MCILLQESVDEDAAHSTDEDAAQSDGQHAQSDDSMNLSEQVRLSDMIFLPISVHLWYKGHV